MRLDPGTAAVEYNTPMLLREVPAAAVHDGSFWCVLLHAALSPDVKATAGLVYHQLLPFLNKRPLRANRPAEAGAGAHWLQPGGDGDRCGHEAATLAAVVAMELQMGRGTAAAASGSGAAALTDAQRLAAAGWQEVHDPSDGATYYYNAATGASEWEKPKLPPLPTGGSGGGQGWGVSNEERGMSTCKSNGNSIGAGHGNGNGNGGNDYGNAE